MIGKGMVKLIETAELKELNRMLTNEIADRQSLQHHVRLELKRRKRDERAGRIQCDTQSVGGRTDTGQPGNEVQPSVPKARGH